MTIKRGRSPPLENQNTTPKSEPLNNELLVKIIQLNLISDSSLPPSKQFCNTTIIMRLWTTVTLLFTLLASTVLCQTNSTNGTDAPEIFFPCMDQPRCGDPGIGCCVDGLCTHRVTYVPSMTTIVVTTLVPTTTYGCQPIVTLPPPRCVPCGTGCCEVGISVCVDGRCSLPF
jgi:hypothetical protein